MTDPKATLPNSAAVACEELLWDILNTSRRELPLEQQTDDKFYKFGHRELFDMFINRLVELTSKNYQQPTVPDEVEDAIRELEYFDRTEEITTIRAHIAALEAENLNMKKLAEVVYQTVPEKYHLNSDVPKHLGFVGTMQNYLTALEAENKRLREALDRYAKAYDVKCTYVDVDSRTYTTYEDCQKWAQAALAQTDGGV